MRTKLLKDISSSTIQVILNQVLGLFVFIIISRYLTKEVYGELNWSLATLTFIITLLGLRLEQVVVRKVAAGDEPSGILTLFSGHIFFSSIFFYLLLLIGSYMFPGFFRQHNLLLILAVSQLLSFFSSPFKQLATGAGKFGWLAVISSVSNLVRSIGLLWIVIFSSLDIQQVIILYIISSLLELLISIHVVQIRMGIAFSFRVTLKDYLVLLHESLPQIGVVFLNACIARVDWILLGFFSTQVITAEYSFAYKVFELSPIPMLIISPVLLTRFSAYFSNHTKESLAERQTELGLLIRFEMILATIFPLILNIIWVPLIDGLTQHKYGSVNKATFFILSLGIPFQYLINLFWTIHFSLNHLALIFRITAITCMVIITGDLLMIPVLNARGAALTYLAAMIVEYLFYLRHSVFAAAKESLGTLVICMGIALVSGFAVLAVEMPVIARLFLSVIIFMILLIITKQVKRSDLHVIKQYIQRAY